MDAGRSSILLHARQRKHLDAIRWPSRQFAGHRRSNRAKIFLRHFSSRSNLFRSTDGAANFNAQKFTLSDGPLAISPSLHGDPRGGENQLYAAPGRPHDLWFAAINGLYHAAGAQGMPSDNRVSFVRMPGVSEIQAFGFGEAGPHRAHSALYLAGTVQGQPGVFRSVDEGQSWVRINDDQHQWGMILRITGDPRTYGRVYVGTHGRGTLFGDPH